MRTSRGSRVRKASAAAVLPRVLVLEFRGSAQLLGSVSPMTADPVRPQETLRDAVRDAAMPPLHQLEVRISGLTRDCACGIVAEVGADAVLDRKSVG